MGTYAYYRGSCHIPEAKRKEFASQMIKILNYGGMMQLETVRMYGHELYLLKPVSIFPGGRVEFRFNYFEDNGWETAGFNADKAVFWSEKIGNFEFKKVVAAAYTLFDLYDDGPGAVEINGDIVNPTPFVGWFNHLLGTEFTNEKRFRLWEMAEHFALYEDDTDSDLIIEANDFSLDMLFNIIPDNRLLLYAGGTELADLCYILKGTESLTESEVSLGSYASDILSCKNRLNAFFQAYGSEAALEKLLRLVCMDREIRKKTDDPMLKEIAALSLTLPARVIVYLASELTGQLFWANWKKLRDSVYRDESMKDYAPAALREIRRKAVTRPVPPVRTSDFLRQGGIFIFYNTPEELEDKPRYYVSDDDRLYWWDGTDEVIISQNMDKWLRRLAMQHADLTNREPDMPDPADSDAAFEDFLTLLAEINAYYKRIFPFQNMFYEFVRNVSRKEYRAAVALMRELHEENKEEGAAIKYIERGWRSWEMTSRKVTFNPGRIRMKRYMAIMANTKLRKKYFGF